MVALPVYQFTAVDRLGNVVPSAQIRVTRESDGGLQSLYSDRTALVVKSNPFFADLDGFCQFYAAPGRYKIEATGAGAYRVWRNVDLQDSPDTSFYQDHADSIPRPALIKMREIFSVEDFGATGLASGNDTLAWQKALTAAAASVLANGGDGRTVFVPSGISVLNSNSITIPNYISLIGESKHGTVIRAANTTGDVLQAASHTSFRRLTFDCASPRTAGAYINAPSASSTVVNIDEVVMLKPAVGLKSGATLLQIGTLDIIEPIATTGVGVEINDGYIVDLGRTRVIGNPAARNFAHYQINHVHDIYLGDTQALSGGINYNLSPGDGQIIGLFHMKGSGGGDDVSANSSLRCVPTGTGRVDNVDIDIPWMLGQPNYYFDASFTTGSGGIGNVRIANGLTPPISGGSGTGTSVYLRGVQNFSVEGMALPAHAKSIHALDCAKGRIAGNKFGAVYPYVATTTAIHLDGTTSNVTIEGNLGLDEVTTAISKSGWSGSNLVVDNNPGLGYDEYLGVKHAHRTTGTDITKNPSTLPSTSANGLIRLAGEDGQPNIFEMDSFGQNNQFIARAANGTAASPTQLVTDSLIFQFAGRGYYSGSPSAYSALAQVAMRFYAAESWTNTARGTYAAWYTTPAGSTTMAESMRLTSRGLNILGSDVSRVIKKQGAAGSALTGSTNESVRATIAIPAGSLGANGYVKVRARFSHTNSANNKTIRARLGLTGAGTGGAVLGTVVANAALNTTVEFLIMNRNSVSSQIGDNGIVGSSTTALPTATIATSSATDLVLTAQLANSGESITLEGYTVDLVYGA